MPIYWGVDEDCDTAHGAPVARPVQAVEDTFRARAGEQGRELSPVEAAAAFFAEFERVLTRIRTNDHILQTAQVIHGADGVLRAVPVSSETRSKNSGESAR